MYWNETCRIFRRKGIPAVLLVFFVRENVVGEVEVDLLSVGFFQVTDQLLERHIACQQIGTISGLG
jgi:hypothetical protein